MNPKPNSLPRLTTAEHTAYAWEHASQACEHGRGGAGSMGAGDEWLQAIFHAVMAQAAATAELCELLRDRGGEGR